MRASHEHSQRGFGEGFYSAISAGVFFILAGAIFVATPGLFEKILTFFRDFKIESVPNIGILLPAPESPATHLLVYSAVAQFSLIWGLFQVVVLALRFILSSTLDKEAETASNIVFWLGASYLINTLLNETTTTELWFAFWAAMLMLVGGSLITRAVILAFRRTG